MEKVLLNSCRKASAVSLTDIGGILVLLLFTGVMGLFFLTSVSFTILICACMHVR